MKKILFVFVCVVILIGLCACNSNPVAESYCDTLAEAEKAIGFKLEAPDSIDGSGTKTFKVSGRTLEIMYFSGKVMNGKISKADNLENINGYDYGYTKVTEISRDGITYSFRGSEDSELVNFATWTEGKYSYLVLKSGGLTEEEMINFCKAIK